MVVIAAFGIFLFLLIGVGCQHTYDEFQRQKQIKAARHFNPANTLGGARFATNDDLKKAGLL